jgi:hypothetical protein
VRSSAWDLALFVDTQHHRVIWRVQVQPDDVANLLDEEQIVRELEALRAVRLQSEHRELPVHGALGKLRLLREAAARPMRLAFKLSRRRRVDQHCSLFFACGTRSPRLSVHCPMPCSAAENKAREIVARLKAMKLRSAAELVEQKVGETLTYYAYPSTHWRQVRTNNPLERIIREIRRRTGVVGAFPDGKSALMLVAARLRHIASTRWGKRRYLVMDTLLNPAKQEVAA